ncbi:MAG: hypothetical protein KKF33_17370, partial [Alphaproteobacteria bacterium]|nr:hypothetical protein [Alphaproteobacteria bacterium]
MARAYSVQDPSELASEPMPGEWQALRGELVALLDQVEGRYARVEHPEPALTGLTQRVRNLRDQVEGPEPAVRRREALRTVKRAVDRFSDRDDLGRHDDEPDALTSAIAEIRGRQMSGSVAALGRRATDMPEFRDLNVLVGGLSGRLERLEGELKHQRTSSGSVQEVASQVEQLTHVVELLAGAVGETGQVKRLEAQIGALAALIEQGPKVDLTTINRRLDDVSNTVAKLAELQAQQMEREIIREDRAAAQPKPDSAAPLLPAMEAIEHSVRNVYDRIDSIERNVALSSGDFERLTAEMAAFTQALKHNQGAPAALMDKVDQLASRIDGFQTANGDVAGLKQDIEDLRDAVMSGMEPRFSRIEDQIEALSERMSPAGDTTQVENQLKLLMARMDETGAQLNGLAKLYAAPSDAAGLEAMATLVAERTSDAVTRKAPAPVAMFGPDSLKSIEDRLAGLIKSAGKTPDYEALADLVAERTSQAVANARPSEAMPTIGAGSMDAFEQRVEALLNTAGRDTAERLARLESALTARAAEASSMAQAAVVSQPQARPSAPAASAPPAPPAAEPAAKPDRLEAMLAALSRPKANGPSDAMPKNPADDAPLLDPGFKDQSMVSSALAAKTGAPSAPRANAAAAPPQEPTRVEAAASDRPVFDPNAVQRPPRPQSSFAEPAAAFAPPPAAAATPQAEAAASHSSTSTFVAAARRAQRARTEVQAEATTGGSAISRALSRFMPDKSGDAAATADAPEAPAKAAKPEKPAKREKPAKAAPVVAAPTIGAAPLSLSETEPSFLLRYRRPLLLAAALVAVSMLALNLVMQRMAPVSAPQPEAAQTDVAPQPSAQPAATDDISLVRPQPRVIDMVDGTTTASINPDASSFSRSSAPTTAMPPSLM